MKTGSAILAVAALLIATGAAGAQVAPKGIGFRAEYLAELSVAENHLVRLAEAIPAQLYTWRPADGVRSVSEVLLHVAGSNLNLPRVLGLVAPESMVGADFHKSSTDKASVVRVLKESFAFLRREIEKSSDADAERTIPFFDGQNTYRGVLYFMARHTGEHSGQLIAYARMNGIIPPWTER